MAINTLAKIKLLKYMLSYYEKTTRMRVVGMCSLLDNWCDENNRDRFDVTTWFVSLDPTQCRKHLGHWRHHLDWHGFPYWFSTKRGPSTRIEFIKEVIELVKADKL